MPWIDARLKGIAAARLEALGLHVTYGKHVNEMDEFSSSSIRARVEDLNDAFLDPSVHLILTVIGGFNSNQLLRHLDYDLIRRHPKVLCGYSDITALANAIFAKTGLVTYYGPHFFSFGEKQGFDYTLEFFRSCLIAEGPFDIRPSDRWSDDRWANDQDHRTFTANDGHWVINEGEAKGFIVGGNQCTLNLLQGTEFMPNLAGAILFLEDDDEAHVATIDRDLQSIIHQPAFDQVRGLVFGRFQVKTGMTRGLLTEIIRSKNELTRMPVLGNVDFGHTTPMVTFPIGGEVEFIASQAYSRLTISRH